MEDLRDSVAIQAAEMLIDEHSRRVQFRPFAHEFKIADPQAAYDVQREYVRLQMNDRRTGVKGYKVGLTSLRMQAMCRIDSPIAGVVMEDRVRQTGARLARSDYGRLGLEFEIAVRLARDLGRSSGGPVTIPEVSEAIDAVCPAIEIVDDRDCDYRTLDVLSLIADNSWNAGIVLGALERVWPDLAEIEGVVSVDGAENDRGVGRDVLGHPYQSVAWLAGHLADAGGGLRTGDIVMTGSLVTTKFPTAPCSYQFELKGLGSVGLSIG
jgi:2-keto-4-pentenoate hydratase